MADSSCIEKVVEIIRAVAGESQLVVVVSAMAGVTNRLLEAAERAEAGDYKAVTAIFEQLHQHFSDEEILDLTICIAAFVALGRTLNVLGIDDTSLTDVTYSNSRQ